MGRDVAPAPPAAAAGLGAPSPTRARTETTLKAVTSCGGDSTATLPNETTSTHFYISHGTIGGGLTITSYVSSLEASWTKQVTSYGWAAPPPLASPPPAPIGTKYPVRVDALSGGLYGYVSTSGTGAGFVGDNPNTPWDDVDGCASCMVLATDYDLFPGTAQQALDATTSHELNHSIQFGYGAIGGTNVPDDSFFEGGSSWMEDEVFDAADDNHNYLWPSFRDSLGDYDSSPYAFWLMVRGLTERFGAGVERWRAGHAGLLGVHQPGDGQQRERAGSGPGQQGDHPAERLPRLRHRRRVHEGVR